MLEEPHRQSKDTLAMLLCEAHCGDSAAFSRLVAALTPQWAPYSRWAAAQGLTEDLRQELWLALWRIVRVTLPRSVADQCAECGATP